MVISSPHAANRPIKENAPTDSGNKRIEPEVLIAAMNVLDHVPLDNSNVSPDVLGDAYEYLIKRFPAETIAALNAQATPSAAP